LLPSDPDARDLARLRSVRASRVDAGERRGGSGRARRDVPRAPWGWQRVLRTVRGLEHALQQAVDRDRLVVCEHPRGHDRGRSMGAGPASLGDADSARRGPSATRTLAAGACMWHIGSMSPPPRSGTETRALSLARRALARPGAPFRELPSRMMLVDVERQTLSLIEAGTEVAVYPVSTAAAGVGGEEGSYRTPPGWHRIDARIGEAAPSGAV